MWKIFTEILLLIPTDIGWLSKVPKFLICSCPRRVLKDVVGQMKLSADVCFILELPFCSEEGFFGGFSDLDS